MRLKDFLTFNSNCPICNNPLTLYMQWTRSDLFKGKAFKEAGTYLFEPYGDPKKCGKDDYLTMSVKGDIKFNFSSSKIKEEAKRNHIYFYFICKEEGIKKESWGDYKINMYKGCYYRSTPMMEFSRDNDSENKSWNLVLLNKEHSKLIQKHESYAFKNATPELEKVYMLDLDWEKEETTLMYYAVTPEQKKIKGFNPNIFDKKMPLLKNRPKVGPENREKLLSRFDSWIIMS
jgi:hypothetical protein